MQCRCDFVSISAAVLPDSARLLRAFLEGQGHEVRFVDAPAHYLDHAASRQLIREFRPDLLVLYTGSKSETNDLQFADPLVTELGCNAVIVGPYASINPEETLSRAQVIDKLVVGEFEQPVGELAAGRKPAEVRNLLYKETGQIRRNPSRPQLTGSELDAIPFVSRFFRNHVDIRRYKTPSEAYPFMDIMTGRGCNGALHLLSLGAYLHKGTTSTMCGTFPTSLKNSASSSKRCP